jgi:hypothetical protein
MTRARRRAPGRGLTRELVALLRLVDDPTVSPQDEPQGGSAASGVSRKQRPHSTRYSC